MRCRCDEQCLDSLVLITDPGIRHWHRVQESKARRSRCISTSITSPHCRETTRSPSKHEDIPSIVSSHHDTSTPKISNYLSHKTAEWLFSHVLPSQKCRCHDFKCHEVLSSFQVLALRALSLDYTMNLDLALMPNPDIVKVNWLAEPVRSETCR